MGAVNLREGFKRLQPLGIPIDTNAPYIPQGNSIAERGCGTIIGITRSLLLKAPHLREKFWGKTLKAAVYIRNHTPTDVLGDKAPLEVWQSKPLGSMKHMHELGAVAFDHIKVRQIKEKLTPRTKKLHLVGYNTHNVTYRLWNPAVRMK